MSSPLSRAFCPFASYRTEHFRYDTLDTLTTLSPDSLVDVEADFRAGLNFIPLMCSEGLQQCEVAARPQGSHFGKRKLRHARKDMARGLKGQTSANLQRNLCQGSRVRELSCHAIEHLAMPRSRKRPLCEGTGSNLEMVSKTVACRKMLLSRRSASLHNVLAPRPAAQPPRPGWQLSSGHRLMVFTVFCTWHIYAHVFAWCGCLFSQEIVASCALWALRLTGDTTRPLSTTGHTTLFMMLAKIIHGSCFCWFCCWSMMFRCHRASSLRTVMHRMLIIQQVILIKHTAITLQSAIMALHHTPMPEPQVSDWCCILQDSDDRILFRSQVTTVSHTRQPCSQRTMLRLLGSRPVVPFTLAGLRTFFRCSFVDLRVLKSGRTVVPSRCFQKTCELQRHSIKPI